MAKNRCSRRTNHPAQEKFITGLYQALDAIDELLADHGPRCQCDACRDFRGQRYTLKVYCDLAEFIVNPFPEMTRRTIAELKRHGYDPFIIDALEATLPTS